MTETTWDYSIQDFSPLFTYSCIGKGTSSHGTNLDLAWQQSCPIAPSQRLGTITVCDTCSSHTTSMAGATVSLYFYGEFIFLSFVIPKWKNI